jgi:hypothetical protein
MLCGAAAAVVHEPWRSGATHGSVTVHGLVLQRRHQDANDARALTTRAASSAAGERE